MTSSACPNCGVVAERELYDIGSGPELSCANCEWCWGAEGQLLKPLDRNSVREVERWAKQQAIDAAVARSFTCPRCGKTSWNPNDVREGYCGACHDWTREEFLDG